MFNFEKLDVWQEASQFADLVYELTHGFPHDERFGLTNQIRRAPVSVAIREVNPSGFRHRPIVHLHQVDLPGLKTLHRRDPLLLTVTPHLGRDEKRIAQMRFASGVADHSFGIPNTSPIHR